jgi:sarcosine oxidase subunit alpha
MDNVVIRNRTQGSGIYDHGYALGYERISDHTPGDSRPRHRLWRIRCKQIIVATGAIERPLSFAGNDIPGVMLAAAVRDYVVNYGVSPGDRTVVVTNNDDAYRTAIVLKDAGLDIPIIIDARPKGGGILMDQAIAAGIRVETGRGIAKVKGGKRVTGVSICSQAGEGAVLEEISCDVVAMSGGWSPVVHLWSHCGGKLFWDASQAMFCPDPKNPPLGVDGESMVRVVGVANGHLSSAAVLIDANEQGSVAAVAAGGKTKKLKVAHCNDYVELAILPVWLMPQGANYGLRSKFGWIFRMM